MSKFTEITKEEKIDINYFDSLIEKLEKDSKINVNFDDIYKKYKTLPIKDRLKVARHLFLYDTQFRKNLVNDYIEQQELAKFRKMKGDFDE